MTTTQTTLLQRTTPEVQGVSSAAILNFVEAVDRITVTFEQNVDFGPTEQPPLTGKAVS